VENELHSGRQCENIPPSDIYLKKICMLNRGKFSLLIRAFFVTKHLGILSSQEAVKMEAGSSSKFWHLSRGSNLIQETH
jgi:hypothetical protein